MRDNPLKTKLASGGRAAGAFAFEFMTPGLPQLCRNAGADFVLYDMEKDPDEITNVAGKKENAEVVREHRHAIEGFLARLKKPEHEPVEMNKERKHLPEGSGEEPRARKGRRNVPEE